MNWASLAALGVQTPPVTFAAQIVAAIAASVTALTAIAAAIFAFQQVRLSQRLRIEQAQPYVALFMEPSAVSPHIVELVVKNFGTTAARNVEIEISPPPLRSGDSGQPATEMEYPHLLSTLVPEQEWRTLWDFGPARVEQNLEGRHTATVKCDGFGRHTQLAFTYELDWEFFTGRRWVQTYGVHDAAKALREMEKHVRGWREGPNRGLKVYVRDGDKRDEALRRERAEAIIERERRLNEIQRSDEGDADD